MKSKSLILYGSPTKLTNAHKPVTVGTVPPRGQPQPPYFVRAETFNGDIEVALDNAKPMEGEILLNTVPVT